MDEFLKQIEKYKDEFYRYIYRSVWDTSFADDVFSSAVLAAYKSRSKFTPGSNFRAWMYRIITNICFVTNREVKKRSQRTELSELSDDTLSQLYSNNNYVSSISNPDDFLAECGDELFIAISKISKMERSCLLLKVMGNFSYKELAGILDIPLGTVMTHLARGRAKLRTELLNYALKEGTIKNSPIEFERSI